MFFFFGDPRPQRGQQTLPASSLCGGRAGTVPVLFLQAGGKMPRPRRNGTGPNNGGLVKMDLRQLAEEYSKSAERLAEGLERIREQLAWAWGGEARGREGREEVMRLEQMDLRSPSRDVRE